MVSVRDTAMDSQDRNNEADSERDGRSLHRRKRVQNLTLLAVLVGFVVLVYFVSIVRMGAE